MPTLPIDARPVTDIPAASAERALVHYESLLEFETDCADVHAALDAGHEGFVVLDVRSPQLFASGHIPGAVNLPQGRINDVRQADQPAEPVPRRQGRGCSGSHRAVPRSRVRARRSPNTVGLAAAVTAHGPFIRRRADLDPPESVPP